MGYACTQNKRFSNLKNIYIPNNLTSGNEGSKVLAQGNNYLSPKKEF